MSTPTPEARAAARTRPAAVTSWAATPTDLYSVICSGDVRPGRRPASSSPISAWMCSAPMRPSAIGVSRSFEPAGVAPRPHRETRRPRRPQRLWPSRPPLAVVDCGDRDVQLCMQVGGQGSGPFPVPGRDTDSLNGTYTHDRRGVCPGLHTTSQDRENLGVRRCKQVDGQRRSSGRTSRRDRRPVEQGHRTARLRVEDDHHSLMGRQVGGRIARKQGYQLRCQLAALGRTNTSHSLPGCRRRRALSTSLPQRAARHPPGPDRQ